MPDPLSALAAGSIGSGIANIFGNQAGAKDVAAATEKANAQANAMYDKGSNAQRDYFQKGYDVLSPVADQGKGVYNRLVEALPELTAPITMDQATLEATPGYKFNVSQGLRAIDLSQLSRGLSGAQAKAAAQFGVNTADTLYRSQFDMAMQNKEAAFNRLLQTATVGTDAAKSIAGNATSAGNVNLAAATGTGKTLSDNTMTAGKAQAAADVNTGATVASTLGTVTGLYANQNRINRLLA